MNFSTLQENFTNSLSTVSRFVTSKSQLPILNNILLTTDHGRLKLSATNLEIGINYWIGAKIEQEGSITVPSKEVTEFVSYLSPGKLDISLNPNNILEIKSKATQSTFATIPAADFPIIPSADPSTQLKIELSSLVAAINQTCFSAAVDDTRPVLTAILWKITPENFSLIATDGYRLSTKEVKLVNPIDLGPQTSLDFLIPARTLSEVAKLSKTQKDIRVGLTPDRRQVAFVLEDVELVSRLIEGDYPDYQRIIPQSSSTTVSLDRQEFIQAIKICSVFARESANVVKFNIGKSDIEISAATPQVGTNKATLEAKIDGNPLKIAFNYKFISDFLSVCQGDQVVIKLDQPLTPGLFLDSSDPSFSHIIMPVSLQD